MQTGIQSVLNQCSFTQPLNRCPGACGVATCQPEVRETGSCLTFCSSSNLGSFRDAGGRNFFFSPGSRGEHDTLQGPGHLESCHRGRKGKSALLLHTHPRTHAHTHKHKCTHTQSPTHRDARAPTDTQTCTNTHLHTYAHRETRTNTSTHTCTHMRTHRRTLRCTGICTHTDRHRDSDTHLHTQLPRHIPARTHTVIDTYVHQLHTDTDTDAPEHQTPEWRVVTQARSSPSFLCRFPQTPSSPQGGPREPGSVPGSSRCVRGTHSNGCVSPNSQ